MSRDIGTSGSLVGFEIWVRWINRREGKFYGINFLSFTTMPAPSSLQSFITPAGTQGVDAAAVTVPDIKVMLLAEEQQVQQDVDGLVKALEEANRKRIDLANKRRDVQVAREKREADAKVRGKLLANAVVAEVRHRFLCQADKVRLAAEKLQAEREAMQMPHKVHMRLGVSFLLAFSSMFRAD